MRPHYLALTLVLGCSSSREPHLDAIEPASATSLVATPAIVRGTGLYADGKVDVSSQDPAQIDRSWHVRIGSTDVAATWQSPEELAITIPAGLAAGRYDVVATSPAGKTASLPGALAITDEPIGLALSIEDAGDGHGRAIAGTLAAGQTVTAFAVVRDANGAFVGTTEASWSQTAAIGTLAAGPSATATWTATTAGTGRLVATRAAAQLSAESGDLAVVAGAPARLEIDDAPGGAGHAIGDRAGLTCDASGGLAAYAVARDAYGNFAGDVAAAWALTGVTGSLPAGAATSAAVDFATPGTGVLHASAGLGSAQTGALEVAPGRAADLAIAPATLTLSADAAPVALAVTAHDGDGNVTTDTGALSWSIASGPITALDGATGVLDPQRAGSGTIAVASSYGPTAMSGTITITPGAAAALAIAPPGWTGSADAAPVAFAATATDADGNATTDTGTLAWSIQSGAITALSAAGVLDPQHAGTGTIAVTSSHGAMATAGVTITPGRAATLTVSPATVDVVAGAGAVAFSVGASDADGNATTDTGTITWAQTGAFGTLDASGVLTPAVPGTGSVRASSSYGASGASGSVRVRKPATLTAVLAAPASIGAGQTVTVTLTVTNTGESDAAGVVPCALAQSGSGAVAVASGPTPASQTIAAGASAPITWTVTGATPGSLSLSACASGADATTGAATSTGTAGAAATITAPARLVATLAAPAEVGRSSFQVTMQVTNTGGGTATGVAPSALAVTGTASATLVAATTGGASIAPNGIVTFTWTYSATSIGTLQFSGSASGTDLPSGQPVVAPTAQSNVIDVVEAITIASDPFGDGSKFGFVCGYHDEVLLGPNASGTTATAFAHDGTNQHGFTFSLPADVTGNKTTNKADPPYPSLGAAGCTTDTLACGPDDEDGRGTFRSLTIGSTQWLIAAGARASGTNTQYLYMTTDTGPLLTFRYVDFSVLVSDHYAGTTALGANGSILYLGGAGDDNQRPRLFALNTTPPSPGLDATAAQIIDLKPATIPGIQAGATEKIDALATFASRLYFANPGAWVRASVAVPHDYVSTPGDWAIITPSAAAYTAKTSRTSTKQGNWEPIDRAVPQFASFGGRLFAGRNTTTGPQLWSCNPGASGDSTQCDAGDWSLVAPNASGDTQLTQFDDSALTSITMVVATPSYLYVGYDGANGATVFRTANPAAATRADFEGTAGCSAAQHGAGACAGYGGAGLGSAQNTRIFDGQTLTFGDGSSSVWITTGSATTPLELVELP